MATISVKDAVGATQAIEKPNPNGQSTMAGSKPVVIASDQSAVPVSISGTIPVSGSFYPATQPVSIASMPSTPVTGTFWQATQPVSLASLPALPTGANTIGAVNVNGTVPVSGTFYPATQAVSATALPLPTGAATEASLAKIDSATAWTDKSAALTGSAQTIMAAVTAGTIRERFIANPSTTANIWVNMVGGTAAVGGQGSFVIAPGNFISLQSVNAVSVIGTSGQYVTAGER